MNYLKLTVLISVLSFGCQSDIENNKTSHSINTTLFELKSHKQTGVDFVNKLVPRLNLNATTYEYFQNGGGVAIADFNNDGLPDLFFTANMGSDKLYLNKGNLKFEDITKKAGVDGFAHGVKNSWSTGVTVGDVNGDGLMDIYISKAGPFGKPENRQNVLYINNGNLTFTERSTEYGLNDTGFSTQAVFFDYDHDRDLDLYVMNFSRDFNKISVTLEREKNLEYTKKFSGKLYQNNDGKFKDVTLEAGVMKFGFGLGLCASDLNDDGWVDLFVANDFSRPDYIYLNNQDGTFTNATKEITAHLSYYSMGCDIADINNDGQVDISVVEMAPMTNFRSKTLMPSMRPARFYNLFERQGFQYQYMYNAFHLNNGNGFFSETAKLSKLHKTDWSWATLLADYDNDGLKDVFVANGYRYNKMENDFNNEWIKIEEKYNNNIPKEIHEEWLTKWPSYKLVNPIFKNKGNLKFSKENKNWGINKVTFSNGAAYGDLDNDGDLDLVINNIDDLADIYENHASEKSNYLQVKLKAGGRENLALTLNAKVRIYTNGIQQFQEYTLTRGFQSACDQILHFGVGQIEKIDSLIVIWNDGLMQKVTDIKVNQRLVIDKTKVNGKYQKTENPHPIFREVAVSFVHKENDFDDFAKEILLPHRNSQHGPKIAVGDVNGDGLDDYFIGGAMNQSGKLFLQNKSEKFIESSSQPWSVDIQSEDVNNVFFDADGDNDLDLYIVSGGNEFDPNSSLLQDRLYINSGKGIFSKAKNALPKMHSSGAAIAVGDLNGDGQMDLFVGGRMIPGQYPKADRSYVLINNKGKFTDKTSTYNQDLENIGIITAALINDIDKDGKNDLIIAGEWTAVRMFKNTGTVLNEMTPENMMKKVGWWSSIALIDVDQDGDMDIVAGNLGENYKYSASEKEPFHIYLNDFDKNGTGDIVLGYFNEGKCFPLRGRECTSEQMPSIKEKFPTYSAFAKASLRDVYGKDLDDALHYEATYFSSTIYINDGNWQFTAQKLPVEAQLSCINGIISKDFDGDGLEDLLIAGNMFQSEPETPRNDASYGLLMKGDGKGGFMPVSVKESGFFANKDVKDIKLVNGKNKISILVANNDAPMQIFNGN